jgi:hypothetical protein
LNSQSSCAARAVLLRGGGFSRRDDRANRGVDCALDIRVPGLAALPHRSGQVSAADEYAVDAVDPANRLEVIKRGGRLGLHEQADFIAGDIEVICTRAPT